MSFSMFSPSLPPSPYQNSIVTGAFWVAAASVAGAAAAPFAALPLPVPEFPPHAVNSANPAISDPADNLFNTFIIILLFVHIFVTSPFAGTGGHVDTLHNG